MPEVNGTTYHDETSEQVMQTLEDARERGIRVRVHYGDVTTGRDWMDLYDVEGTLSRSTGPTRIPILVANRRSTGGPGVLSHCIVRVRHANRKHGGDLYRHRSYHLDPRQADRLDERTLARSFT